MGYIVATFVTFAVCAVLLTLLLAGSTTEEERKRDDEEQLKFLRGLDKG